MEESSTIGMQNNMDLDKWTEDDVGSWLKHIGIKELYINKLKDEEVTGPVLASLCDNFLRKNIGMKSGQIQHLLSKRDQLLKAPQQKETGLNANDKEIQKDHTTEQSLDCESQAQQQNVPLQSSEYIDTLTWSEYCEFDNDGKDFRYIKHSLLAPETGTENLLVPCHEYKSLEIAQKLDSKRLQVKVASEVLRFACACMNMRSNGTIHFGVMDKVKGSYKHGEIVGIEVRNREDFVDALDYIEKCFKDSSEQCDARKCIRNPRFIEVIEKETTGKTYVVEYDVVPEVSIVKDKFYSVGVPKFHEKDKKIKLEIKVPYCRVGANTPQISTDNFVSFIQSLTKKDQQREEAECTKHPTTFEYKEDQRRKLSILLTSGRKHMDNSLYYIIVTNKFHPQHLEHIAFLVNMNTVCVFDFDPDSLETGLCAAFRKQKAVTPHFLHDYLNEEQSNLLDFSNKLGLFEKVSWIFCNGRNDFHKKEKPCDEKTWIKTKKKKLKKAVSFICNELLPRRSFIVLFMLMSDVQQPLVETFSEFYEEMNGHESLVVLSESKENYKKWSSLAQICCEISTLNEIAVTGMPLSHMNATVQSIQLSKNQTTRTLPVSNGGVCYLKSTDEAMLHSLEIISVDQCENTDLDIMDQNEINATENRFYHGGKIDWINFWLSDKHKCGNIIKRDAFHEANSMLEKIISPKPSRPIENVNIYHQPGSGGSTVARQLLWSWKNKVRCAVVKQCKEITTVSEHAVKLREYEERDQNNCFPVLLLLEDQKTEDIDNLRRELRNNITSKNITSSALCFILLICNRTNDPERACRMLPSQNVAITHKLSQNEKPMFSKKHKELEDQLELPHPDYILTFVLMSKGFDKDYIVHFVRNTLSLIDRSSSVTHLIRFVALLNSYVESSYLSMSHCEAYMGIVSYIPNMQYHAFVDALSEEAKLLFVDLRDNTTHFSSIRIIHKLVAEELLKQLSKDLPQSAIAKALIQNNVLINHRFGRDEFLKFIKALVIRRNKKSRGDSEDTAFSPLTEHITITEGLQKAIELLTNAYNSLGKDGIVAQQLARLLYTNQKFEEALEWAEKAKSFLPSDTFVLDTLGQVYKRWFYHLFDSVEEELLSPERGVEIISTALKAISAFRDSEKTPKKDTVSLNSSYFGEVDVGCRLLKFLTKVDIFAITTGKSLLLNYLLTEYIPETVKKPWQKFHSLLKGLQKGLLNALERISEDLCYFQTDFSEEDVELDASDLEQLYRPREWLTRKSKVYAEFFCKQLDDNNVHTDSATAVPSPPQNSQFQRQMMTYKLGGGNVTSIMSLIYNKDTKASGDKLERILDMYHPLQDLDPEEVGHFIYCQIALNCIKPGSSKLQTHKHLQDLYKWSFKKGKFHLSINGLYLATLLFWPETDSELNPFDSKILLTAIDHLQKYTEEKIQRKRRTVDHFYFGKAKGLNKIVHKSVIEKQTGSSERKEKWLGGEVWKTPTVTKLLKRFDGWTENGRLFVKCGDKEIRVSPRYSASMPLGYENVTFYLGFSFGGVVASDIQVKE
ncbi:LOW QUALITY PROTEIN: sterile alpha motif domain-containing protein 9-like [Boleophthalmus pectinirostris]|uniref:LOW QUALITY PROTEIN: sterile alpha motif domain-containing protein 9-like n=1 Tax=Boleophthalmus pectinirostris TaxID=150288 RepID=UPI00242F6ED3|nr:LOW QUALITY PROTEIN: sterile alpha motif domain-containing protein 9-like [Boleophthalmus pectinirostris]